MHFVGSGYIIINLYHTTRRHMPKDNHHIHHSENGFSLLPTHTDRLWVPPITVASKRGLKRRDVNQTTHLNLFPRLRMSRALLTPCHMPSLTTYLKKRPVSLLILPCSPAPSLHQTNTVYSELRYRRHR